MRPGEGNTQTDRQTNPQTNKQTNKPMSFHNMIKVIYFTPFDFFFVRACGEAGPEASHIMKGHRFVCLFVGLWVCGFVCLCVSLSWSHRCSDRRDFWHTCSLPSWEGYRLSNAPQARHAAKPRHAAPQARKKKKTKKNKQKKRGCAKKTTTRARR